MNQAAELDYIDIYCERLSGAYWAEPINAATNLAFLIGAFFAYRFWKAKKLSGGQGEKDILLLIIVLAAVGLGSFLFHTFASPWSLLADVLPIGVFIHVAIFSAAYRVFGLPCWPAIAVAIVFLALSMLWEAYIPSNWLNGSVTYLPALGALVVMSACAKNLNLQAFKPFALAAILLLASLSFRSIDMATCGVTAGIGTHFMWHILNGFLMFKVIEGLLLGGVKKV